MKLINTRTLQLADYTFPRVPAYAVLSHTWEGEEVSYQEMISGDAKIRLKKGFEKISRSCKQALNDSLELIWIDTCCINKESSAELAEGINSMFKWYARSAKCYVYLSDLSPEGSTSKQLVGCRWFTRGWTLQELLAPSNLEFFDMNWTCRGSKTDFLTSISRRTGIDAAIIEGTKSLRSCSVAQRMSWAAERQTSRTEDVAYCLLGIFDINMPMLYGEGSKAFRRLQEEIMKRSNDLSIFAWEPATNFTESPPYGGMRLLAIHPSEFKDSPQMSPGLQSLDYLVTNKGLRISGEVDLHIVNVKDTKSKEIESYAISLGWKFDKDWNHRSTFMFLRKIGPKLFCRNIVFSLETPEKQTSVKYTNTATDVYIVMDPADDTTDLWRESRSHCLRFSCNRPWTRFNLSPATLFDVHDAIFLSPKTQIHDKVIAIEFFCDTGAGRVRVVVLCDCRKEPPTIKLFQNEKYEQLHLTIFQPHYGENGWVWFDLETQAPGIRNLTPFLIHTMRSGRLYKIMGTIAQENTKLDGTTDLIDAYHLRLTVDEVQPKLLGIRSA